ncbi:hypothetical protein OHD55_21635 [Escherichia coli]|nr:hypothetical protein [Escherichia coli]
MQNRIKLFYRPAGIAPVNKATFKKVTGKSQWQWIGDKKMTQLIG